MIAGDHGICLGNTAPAAERGKCSAQNNLMEVYSADDASRRIPVLISRLEYRRRRLYCLEEQMQAVESGQRTSLYIHRPCDGFECIHDTTVEVITG